MISKSFTHWLKKLLKEALDFANSYVNIPENYKKIMNHASKKIIAIIQQSWFKKKGGLLDVTMGAYDKAEHFGYFLLYALLLKYNKINIGLYRVDRWAVVRSISGPHSKKIKKEFQAAFLKINH